MKIENRNYKCGICGTEEKVQTNHQGEIYSGCKCCGNSVLYCTDLKRSSQDKATLKYYYFNIEQNEKEYNELLEKLNNRKLKRWIDSAPYCTNKFNIKWKNLKLRNGTEFEIFNKSNFKGQYVSKGIRLHDWVECEFPNKRIKQGYYLEF